MKTAGCKDAATAAAATATAARPTGHRRAGQTTSEAIFRRSRSVCYPTAVHAESRDYASETTFGAIRYWTFQTGPPYPGYHSIYTTAFHPSPTRSISAGPTTTLHRKPTIPGFTVLDKTVTFHCPWIGCQTMMVAATCCQMLLVSRITFSFIQDMRLANN